MILLNYVIEIFDLSYLNLFLFWNIFVKIIKSRFVATAFINSDFIRSSIILESLPKEGFCSYRISLDPKKKINRIAFFIHRPIEIDPFAIQFDIRVSRPRELPPRPLSEPDVNLSAHPVPTIQPFWHNSLLPKWFCRFHCILLLFKVAQSFQLNSQAPLLHHHYNDFIALTGLSAPVPCLGTLILVGHPLEFLP